MKNTLQIVKAQIEISSNSLIEGGYFYDVKLQGILPGCKKVVVLHHNTMIGYLWLKPLFGGSGEARVSPSSWRSLMKTIPVVVKPYDKDVIMTPELEAKAREYALSFADMTENAEAQSGLSARSNFDEIVMVQAA